MSTIAEEDVAVAVAAVWNASPELAEAVPGNLQRGRLSSYQANADRNEPRQEPYAGFEVSQGPYANVDLSDGTRIDYRHVRVQIWGLKAAVARALPLLRPLFNRTTYPVPNSTLLGSVEVPATNELKQDEHTKRGEDVWIGTYEFWVSTQRSKA